MAEKSCREANECPGKRQKMNMNLSGIIQSPEAIRVEEADMERHCIPVLVWDVG